MTLEQVLAELENPDPQVRVCAARWLRVIGALDDSDPESFVPVRVEVALG